MTAPIDDLKTLVGIPSFSGEEKEAADWIQQRIEANGIPTKRSGNNVWAYAAVVNESLPTILLNSHLDTVGIVAGWDYPAQQCTEDSRKLFGLGVNDAGASLIGLLYTFFRFYDEQLAVNLVFLASAEEENSGVNGFESVRDQLGKIDMAIVGEPTGGKVAIAEKGLLVIDALAVGEAGHAARNTGTNAIYKALADIEKLKAYSFTRISEKLGPVWINVTAINGGDRHNVIPDRCSFTLDIRLNERYTHQEILEELQAVCSAELTPRSMRLCASGLPENHVLERAALKSGLTCFGSPTMSDQALMPWPSVKFGIGESERSHTANEYILIEELDKGIALYEGYIKQLNNEIMG